MTPGGVGVSAPLPLIHAPRCREDELNGLVVSSQSVDVAAASTWRV